MSEGKKLIDDSGVARLKRTMEQAGLTNRDLLKNASTAEQTMAFARDNDHMRRLRHLSSQQTNLQATAAMLSEMVQSSFGFNDRWANVVRSFQRFDFSRVFSAFDWLIEEGRKATLVENTGWLPHHTTPFDLLDEQANQVTAASTLGDYYRDNWEAVEKEFVEQLEGYGVDDEAKSTFKEALKAHRQGLFRVGPRLLFPEIERVCSKEFFDGKHTVEVTTPKGRKTALPITRLKEVREMMLKLPVGHLKAYEYSWQLFKKVEEHLYEDVDESSEAEVERYRNDPVPNRHAALHGIVSYKTQQTSLNSIIMADFIYHMVSQLKRYAAALENDDEGENEAPE